MRTARYLLTASLLLALTLPAPAAAAAPVILLDGWRLDFPVPPQVIGGRTMVPFRAIAEALGVAVAWEGETMTIRARGLGKTVVLQVDNQEAEVDGAAVRLDVPPLIVDSRTLVPLRFFSEVFGAGVSWESGTQTVHIGSPRRRMEGLAFYAIRSYQEIGFVPKFGSVAFGWSSLSADGEVLMDGPTEYRWPEPDGDITGERILEVTRGFGVQRLLMVHRTDGDGALTRLVLDESRSQAAAASMAEAAISGRFDGIVVDLEGLGLDEKGEELEQVREGFTRLVQLTGAALRQSNRKLFVAVHPPNGWYRGYDLAAIAAHADRLVLMAHDYVKVDDGQPEPPALVDEAIRLTLGSGVVAEQVLLALNVYVESPESLTLKVGLAKRYGLAGLSVWRLGLIKSERMKAIDDAALLR